jgi:hypothetical protein
MILRVKKGLESKRNKKSIKNNHKNLKRKEKVPKKRTFIKT